MSAAAASTIRSRVARPFGVSFGVGAGVIASSYRPRVEHQSRWSRTHAAFGSNESGLTGGAVTDWADPAATPSDPLAGRGRSPAVAQYRRAEPWPGSCSPGPRTGWDWGW